MKKDIDLTGTYYMLMKYGEVIFICDDETLAIKMYMDGMQMVTLDVKPSSTSNKEYLLSLIKEFGSKALKERVKNI